MAIIKAVSSGINPQSFKNSILKEISVYLDGVVKKASIVIKKECASIVDRAIRTSVEYNAMLENSGSVLYGEIGRPDIDKILNQIIEKIKSEIIVNPFPTIIANGGLSGGLEVKILELSHKSLFSIKNTYFLSENGFDVNWLQWLLFEGTKTVVFNYTYSDTGKQQNLSRTGTGIMIKSKKNWGMDGRFSGVAGNNWLTRSMDTIEKDIPNLIINSFAGVI